MLADEKPVAWNQRCGFKAKPTVPLYTRPAPVAPQAEQKSMDAASAHFEAGYAAACDYAADLCERFAARGMHPQECADAIRRATRPKAEPCIGNDPACPCQDGDACHYKDAGGTKAWPVPQAERPPTCRWSRADDDTDMWETTCGKAFTIIDGSPADNQMAFCCYCGRELESETGGSDAE